MLSIGLTVTVNANYDTTLEKTIEFLKAEGFGILTEIDVKATLKKKLNVDFRRYKILGACNPPLAHHALTLEAQVGVLLPCNVTVGETDDSQTEIMIMNPMMMAQFFENPELKAVATEANARLERVKVALEEYNATL